MQIWKKILAHYNSWKLGHKLLCAFALAYYPSASDADFCVSGKSEANDRENR